MRIRGMWPGKVFSWEQRLAPEAAKVSRGAARLAAQGRPVVHAGMSGKQKAVIAGMGGAVVFGAYRKGQRNTGRQGIVPGSTGGSTGIYGV